MHFLISQLPYYYQIYAEFIQEYNKPICSSYKASHQSSNYVVNKHYVCTLSFQIYLLSNCELNNNLWIESVFNLSFRIYQSISLNCLQINTITVLILYFKHCLRKESDIIYDLHNSHKM